MVFRVFSCYVPDGAVGNFDSPDLFNYGEEINGWWVFFDKLNPFSKSKNLVSLGEVITVTALACLHCHSSRCDSASSVIPFTTTWSEFISDLVLVDGLQRTRTELFEYVHPPVDNYGLLQWKLLEEIEAVGYDYVKPLATQWAADKVACLVDKGSDSSRCFHFSVPIPTRCDQT
jgi:hypothetical protein